MTRPAPHTNPRPVTTGVTPLSKPEPTPPRAGIDWLQYSVEWPPSLRSWPSTSEAVMKLLHDALPPCDSITLTGEVIRPTPGYNGGMGATHARLFWHSLNRTQCIGVVMTGADLGAVLAIPYPHDALIRWCVAKAHKIARLDFALDVFDPASDPLDLLHEWKRGELATPARYVQELTSYAGNPGGDVQRASTVYIGARQSDRQLRVYNKAAQLQLGGHWTRIELQLRDSRAWQMARAMVLHGIARAGQQAIRDYINAPRLTWWQRATSGDTAYIEPVGKKQTATEKWLIDVALPVARRVAREQIADGRWTMYDAIERVLTDLLQETKPDAMKARKP